MSRVPCMRFMNKEWRYRCTMRILKLGSICINRRIIRCRLAGLTVVAQPYKLIRWMRVIWLQKGTVRYSTMRIDI